MATDRLIHSEMTSRGVLRSKEERLAVWYEPRRQVAGISPERSLILSQGSSPWLRTWMVNAWEPTVAMARYPTLSIISAMGTM